MCALYLRGGPKVSRLSRARWPKVLHALRVAAVPLDDCEDALRSSGLWPEAMALACPDRLAWSARQVAQKTVLTAADDSYPLRWLRVLGSGAPPCLWIEGSLPTAPAVGLAGSRQPGSAALTYSWDSGRLAMSLGRVLVSGGAQGCDAAAAQGALSLGDAARVVEILPHGLRRGAPGVVRLSVCAPGSSFSSAQAMERNALIYAMSDCTVAVEARLKEGGTWAGAADALRRRLCRVAVYQGSGGSDALQALGAVGVSTVEDLREAVLNPAPLAQPELFGANIVREQAFTYG